MMVAPSAGSEIQPASLTSQTARKISPSRSEVAEQRRPHQPVQRDPRGAGDEQRPRAAKLTSTMAIAVGRRPGAVGAPDHAADGDDARGATIRPRLIMSRETSTSGDRLGRRVTASVHRVTCVLGRSCGSRSRRSASCSLHLLVVAVLHLGEHADRRRARRTRSSTTASCRASGRAPKPIPNSSSDGEGVVDALRRAVSLAADARVGGKRFIGA